MAATNGSQMFFGGEFMTEDDDIQGFVSTRLRHTCAALYRKPTRVITRVENYMDVVNAMDDDTFQGSFRISRQVFDALHQFDAPHITARYVGGRRPIITEVQVLAFVKYISSQQSLREVSEIFGISEAAAHRIVNNVSDVITATLKDRVIQWPDAQRRQEIATAIERASGLPGVVGFLDGSHIRLVGKIGGDTDYINRKGYASMQLQLVVDHEMRILSVYTGWPSCVHDVRVLRNSMLYHEAEAGHRFSVGEQLFCDAAYPLRNWLISPFRNLGHLTRRQRRFNTRFSGQRQCVERTIGVLKGRFRLLKEIPVHSAERVVKLITSACILHNLCLCDNDGARYFIRNAALRPNRYPNVYQHGYNGVLRRAQLLNRV